jgi:hypothetical protein
MSISRLNYFMQIHAQLVLRQFADELIVWRLHQEYTFTILRVIQQWSKQLDYLAWTVNSFLSTNSMRKTCYFPQKPEKTSSDFFIRTEESISNRSTPSWQEKLRAAFTWANWSLRMDAETRNWKGKGKLLFFYANRQNNLCSFLLQESYEKNLHHDQS